jgi:hypothetical protein
MSLPKRIDLLIKEVLDSSAQENFAKLKSFIDSLFTVAMAKDRDNVMTSGSSIQFPTITNTNTQVDMLRVPVIAGAPTVAPLTSGEGYMVWDSTNNKLYVWDGSSWAAMN